MNGEYTRARHRHAIVIGASMGGLAAARVLADHFDSVTVLDRDDLPPRHEPRKGVPQGRHAHALLASGALAIADLFPGILDEMVAAGAALIDFNDGSWYQAGGYRAGSLIERKVISATRPFIEGHIRRRVLDLANVTIERRTAVGLLHDGDRVLGVRVADGDAPADLAADLVVDCTGRGSPAANWLADLGYPEPDVTEVRCDTRYATMMLPRLPGAATGSFGIVIESPPRDKRAYFVLPAEGDRWQLTMSSGFGAPAPADEAGFRELVAGLPAREIHDTINELEALGPVVHHRLPSSKRRRYERLRVVPAGFVALGDSICSFNPVYGQGMSSAVLQAAELGACLPTHRNDGTLVRAFYQRAAKVIDNPWRIAVGSDFAYPECAGDKPLGTDLVNGYMKRVLTAAHVSPEVNTAMIKVQNLLAPPSSLMRPAMMVKVLRAARRSPAARRERPAPLVTVGPNEAAARAFM